MIEITYLREMRKVHGLTVEVQEAIKGVLEVLDSEYGFNKMSIVFLLIFVLHDLEEQHYPDGFLNHIMDLTGMHVSKEIQRGSRIPTSIYLFVLTLVPFFVSQYPLLIIPSGFLGIWEGYCSFGWNQVIQC